MVEGDCFGGGVSLWSTTRRSVLTEISFFRARFQHFFALRWYFNILRQLITRSRIFRMNVAYTSVVQFSFECLLETLVLRKLSPYHMVHMGNMILYGAYHMNHGLFIRLGKTLKIIPFDSSVWFIRIDMSVEHLS